MFIVACNLVSRLLSLVVVCVFALNVARATAGETLFSFSETQPAQKQPQLQVATQPKIQPQSRTLPPPPQFHQDNAVVVAEHVVPTQPSAGTSSVQAITQQTVKSDPRRLAPRSRNSFAPPANNGSTSDRAALPFSSPQMESLGTAGAGLAIVIGLFLMCAWLLRRGGPKPNSPLPKDVVAVLGRVPLVGRNFAQLIQIGNKLILVSIAPDGTATPITEVTDPTEVDRLLSIVMRNRKQSTTAEFQQVLQQLANEPAKGFLGS